MSMATTFDIQWVVPFHKITRSFNYILQGHIKYFSYCISTSTRAMALKLGKVVTYYKKVQFIKSHNPLIN